MKDVMKIFPMLLLIMKLKCAAKENLEIMFTMSPIIFNIAIMSDHTAVRIL